MTAFSNISIQRSLAHVNAWMFMCEIDGQNFVGYFDNLPGLILAVEECAKVYAIRHGLLRVVDAGLTRPMMPGDIRGENILPGDRAQ